MTDVFSIISNGLAAAGLTLLIRAAIEWSGEGYRLHQRPWGCNLCMAFWTSLATTVWALKLAHPELFLGTYFVSYALLESFWRPLPPLLEDSDPPPAPKNRN
jgi:hypothetical protein